MLPKEEDILISMPTPIDPKLKIGPSKVIINDET